jgi:hypothetical protein
VINTVDPEDIVKHTAIRLAIALDETALVQLNSVVDWAA